ncbi:putative reverse transcriptase domain-containing protein, partial [Tanacetum coccineum]
EPSEGSGETKPFDEDETVVTPPPPRHRRARISVRPQTPMDASTQALIDAFAARSPTFLLPPTIPAYDMPPWRRFVLTAPPPECDVAESSAAAARPPRAADRAKDVGYVRALQASEHKMMTFIEEVNLRVSYQAQVRRRESEDFYTHLHDAQTNRRDIRLEIDVLRGQRTAYETELRKSAEDLAVRQMMRTQILEARARIDMVEGADSSWNLRLLACPQWLEKSATCTLLGAALTWWNGHVRTLGHDAAYAMTWGTLKKKLTDKYYPKGKIKKLEIKLWSLKVRGNDVAAYIISKERKPDVHPNFLPDETEKVDKFIRRLTLEIYLCAPSETTTTPDNVHPSVETARGACYECGNTRHIKKNFPKLKNRGNGNGNGVA